MKPSSNRVRVIFGGDLALCWRPSLSSFQKLRFLCRILWEPALRADLRSEFRRSPLVRPKKIIANMAACHGVFEGLEPILRSAQAICVNLEGVLSLEGRGIPGKRYHLRASPDHVYALTRNGISTVGLANNHVLDFGREAVNETVDLLSSKGINISGLQVCSKRIRQMAAILPIDGANIGVLSYVDPAIIDPSPESFFSDYPRPYPMDTEAIIDDLRANKQLTDIVIVQLHWGIEWSHTIRDEQRQLARQLIVEGASVVVGHHPHVLQEYEEYGDGLIFYSLGNMLMPLPGIMGSRSQFGILSMLAIERNRIVSYEAIPIEQRKGRPFPGRQVTFDHWTKRFFREGNKTSQPRFRLSNSLKDCQIKWQNAHERNGMKQRSDFSLLRIPCSDAYCHRETDVVAASREFYGSDLRYTVLCYTKHEGIISIQFRLNTPGVMAGFVAVPNCFLKTDQLGPAFVRIQASNRIAFADHIGKKEGIVAPFPIDSPTDVTIEVHGSADHGIAVGFDVILLNRGDTPGSG
jgi:poly-gamma-glutamate capsule biosynthesis protein CapA/YwtB (metallophosphatase superfamily)